MTIGVGIVGLSARGGWAALAHVPALRALPENFRITALSASSPESAALAADRFGVPFCTADPAELAAHPNVDLVVIAVKVPEHRALIEQVIGAGKATYCEWPLGNGLAEAEHLSNIAATARIDGFIGLQARSAPPLRFLQDLLATGYVGRLLSSEIQAVVEAPWNGRSSQRRAYLNNRSNGATMLTIPFAHCLDAVTEILGSISDIKARMAIQRPEAMLDDGTTLRSDVEDHIGVLGRIGIEGFGSFLYLGGDVIGEGFRWEIIGTEGRLLVTGHDGHLQYGHVQLAGARGREALQPIAIAPAYARVAMDPASHAFTVAHAYLSVADAMSGGPSGAPRFEDAVALHRTIDQIEKAAA